MPLLHIAIVALIQGITEFLPISSSGHLILLPRLTGLADQGQAMDIAVHVGTLGAVILYFSAEVRRVLTGISRLASLRPDDPDAQLALGLIIATIPVVLVGLAVEMAGLESALRSIKVVGWATLIFGIFLWWADRNGPESLTARQWTLKHALILGLWQLVALIPGTSRSGIVITGGRLLGYTRHDAAKISMLMSIPTILASGVLLSAEVTADINAALAKDAAIGAAFAFVAALAALHFMMLLLRSVSFTPYVIYRVLLGVALLAIAYT